MHSLKKIKLVIYNLRVRSVFSQLNPQQKISDPSSHCCLDYWRTPLSIQSGKFRSFCAIAKLSKDFGPFENYSSYAIKPFE
jgi:hypothetical protein